MQQAVLMHTSVGRQSLLEAQVRLLQHGRMQRLRPSTVLMQEHSFLVFVHATSHPGLVSVGHIGAASASRAAAPSPATPNNAAPANLSARRLVMVPLAYPRAKSSKGLPDAVARSSISSPPPVHRAGPFGVISTLFPGKSGMNHWLTSENPVQAKFREDLFYAFRRVGLPQERGDSPAGIIHSGRNRIENKGGEHR